MPDHEVGTSIHKVLVALQAWCIGFAQGAATKLMEPLPAREVAGFLPF